MDYKIILIPIISSVIGWFTNYIAVYLLFHPKEPINILGFKLQGIFPKRQSAMGEKIGKMVAERLVSFEDLKEKLVTDENMASIISLFEQKLSGFISTYINEKLGVLGVLVSEKKRSEIKNEIVGKVENELPGVIDNYIHEIENKIDIEKMVKEKFDELDSDNLSHLLNDLLKKEFKFIEILGAVVGLLIGIIQVLIFYI